MKKILNPYLVLTFAKLLAMVSTFVCCAIMPVAAVHKLLTICSLLSRCP